MSWKRLFERVIGEEINWLRPILEVTFRRGRPFAAYLYLPRKVGVKAARTEDRGHGLLIDFDENNTPIGIEIMAPNAVTIDDVNALLTALGIDSLLERMRPVRRRPVRRASIFA